MKISDPLGKVYTHTMFKKRSYDMRGGNGNGGEIPEGNIYFVYNSKSFYTNLVGRSSVNTLLKLNSRCKILRW